jgi:hypothetical protein
VIFMVLGPTVFFLEGLGAGWVLAAAGLILSTLRRYLIIDTGRNSIGRYFGVLGVGLIPIERWDASSARAVRLGTKSEKDSEGDSYSVFVLSIVGIKDDLFVNRLDYRDSRRLGIDMARLLNVPFSDAMSGRVSTLPPEHFDLCLAARARLNDAAIERPTPPITPLATFREVGDRTIVTLPATRDNTGPAFVAGGLIALVAISLMLFVPDPLGGFMMGIVLLFAAALLLRLGWMALEPVEITIDADRVAVRCTPLFHRTARFDSVQDCVLGATNLYLIGAKKVVRIPYDFGRGEVREIGKFLRDKIWHAARGGRL